MTGMALTPADIEEFISALHDDAGLRERVRGAILSDDFLALPGITARVEESLDRLTQRVDGLAARTDEVARGLATLTVRTDALAQRMDQLTARMDEFAQRMDQLTARMDELAVRMDQLTARMDELTDALTRLVARIDHMDGRLGNVEGGLYELKYERNLGAHLARLYRKVSRVIPADVDAVANAYESGLISEDEWDDLHRVDMVASATRRKSPSGGAMFVLLEISLTVDERDVARASRRADIMRRAAVEVEAAVGGEKINAGAITLARELGVTVLISKEADAA